MILHHRIRPSSILIACLACCVWIGVAAAPRCSAQDIPRIIFDSDMSSDHDDAADIAVLHALADTGECEILACMASSQNGGTAVAFNSINAYFGRPDIPCGRRPDCGGPGAYPGTLIAEFPHPLYATWQDPPLCLDLYRRILAAQPDHSVSIVTTGYMNNIEALMRSGPDANSPLTGMDLCRQKVKLLACAGGCYPGGNEFNFRVEPAAAQYVINNWPTAAFFDGYDVGQAIYSGAGLERTGRDNPIRRAFELSFFGPYPTWGQLMVYYAVRSAESQVLWNYNTTGHNTCDATGSNAWSTDRDPSGAQEQGYMLEIERFPVQQAIETLVMNSGAPRSKGTVKPPNQPTNLRGTIAGANRIDLQWTDNAWNETGFVVERRVDGTFTPIATLGAGVTSYADTGLSSTANQNYRVKAVNAIGGSDYATVAVYTGWTEINTTAPNDHSPIYHYYQNNLNWIRGPNVCGHLAINNDSTHGQDLSIDVQVAAQGAYGRYYVYFFYQDLNNWYRLSAGSQGEGQANNVSRFEKCINGTITQIGAAGTGVNLGNGCHLITWKITVSHDGTMTFANDNNPTGNATGVVKPVLSVTDTLSFTSGKIALGSNIGQPVWDDFSFDTVVGGSGGGSVTPPSAVAPAITAQPANRAVTIGRTATFTVSASGTPAPTFQWQRDGANIGGATSASYTTPATVAGDNGATYRCVVTNSAGSATSNAATVTVAAASTLDPLIPAAALISDGAGSFGGNPATTADKAFDGDTATFYDCANPTGSTGIDVGAGKTATVTAIRYWARAGFSARMASGVFEGSNTLGSGYVTLGTVASASDTAWTTLTVSGAAPFRYLRYRGPSVCYVNVAEIEFRGAVTTTAPATVAPAITGQPANRAVTVGQTATFTVTASGTPAPTFQWQRNGVPIGGATAASYTTPATVAGDNGATYRCVVTNSAGSATSSAATLTVASVGGLDPVIPMAGLISDGAGSYAGNPNHTADKAYDGDTATFYDCANPDGSTGIDVGAGQSATVTAIRYWARAGFAPRMAGGVFEGSNSPTSGYVALGTVAGASDTAWTTLTVSGAMGYRFLRYRGPSGCYCNVAEIEFHGTLSSTGGGGGTAWADQDVGATGAAGSVTSSSGAITVTGSGADIWGGVDAFEFSSQPLTGDGSIVARVVSLQNTDGWAKAGVMIREGAGAGATHAFCCVTAANGVAFQRRTATSSISSHTAGSLSAAPRWVKLVRQSSTIVGYESADGATWTAVGSTSIDLADPVRIGLAVTSHHAGVPCTAVFDHVVVTPGGSG